LQNREGNYLLKTYIDMLILNFESEEFDVRELQSALQNSSIPEGISVTVKEAPKAEEGKRPVYNDILEIAARVDVPVEVLKFTLTSAVSFAFGKLSASMFAQPYILVRFANGAKRKILYDKGDAAIVEELLGYVQQGDVTRIVFKP
jgi:hypothetical protein